MLHQSSLSIVCLGTGRGASMVYDGNCSTGYVLCVDGAPAVLFGVGYGVTRQCLRYFGVVPTNIAVFSNRSHMSAELPVVIAVESRKGRRPRVIASEAVMVRLMQHRLAEMHSRVAFGVPGEGGVCDFVNLHTSESLSAVPYYLPDFPDVALSAFNAASSLESSCGFVVLHRSHPVLALTGDCACDKERYKHVLRAAPVAIVDGRKKGSLDHASFDDVVRAVEDCKSCGWAPRRVFIGQYGELADAPSVVSGATVLPIVEGAVVELCEGMCVGDAGELFTPSTPEGLEARQASVLTEQRAMVTPPVGDCELTPYSETRRVPGDESSDAFVMRMAYMGDDGRRSTRPEVSASGGKEAVTIPDVDIGSITTSTAFEEYMQRAYCALQRDVTYGEAVCGFPQPSGETPHPTETSTETIYKPRSEEAAKRIAGYTCRFTTLKT